jgi:hypothetical protein
VRDDRIGLPHNFDLSMSKGLGTNPLGIDVIDVREHGLPFNPLQPPPRGASGVTTCGARFDKAAADKPAADKADAAMWADKLKQWEEEDRAAEAAAAERAASDKAASDKAAAGKAAVASDVVAH